MIFEIVVIILSQASLETLSLLSCRNLEEAFATHSNYISSHASRILLIQHPWVTQTDITETLQHYSQLRDIHRGTLVQKHKILSSLEVLYYNLVAVTLNATLIPSTSLPDNCIPGNWRVSKIIYPVTVSSIKRLFEKNASHVTLTSHISLNFAYCRIRQKQGSSSSLVIFRNTADYFVWLSLAMSIIATSALVKASFSIDFSLSILTTSSVLLSPGVSGTTHRSKLFLLWMFVSLLFLTYYTGSLTSVVMKPSPDKHLSTIQELEDHNYSAVVDTAQYQKLVKGIVENYLYWVGTNKKIKKNHLPRRFAALRKLILSSTAMLENSWSMNHQVVDGIKLAYIKNSQSVIKFANKWNEYFSQNNASEIRCYIGQELNMESACYEVAISPEGGQLFGIIKVLTETGILARFNQEYVALKAFNRVQDRSRFISLTKLAKEVDMVKSLKLSDGKLTGVFLLWAICLACCFTLFALEKLYHVCGFVSTFLWIRRI